MNPVDGTALVEARRVSKVYGRQRALGETTLALRAGESVALLGANGAGKSTLLGILSGSVRPTTGEVLVDGRPFDARARHALGMLAHESLCYGDLTGRENLVFFARLYRTPVERVDEMLDRVGIAHAAERFARTYSRGMLQRLAAARALLHRPRLLLLDEPFTGLDVAGQTALVSLLASERDRGATLVVVSHDFGPLAGLVSRALVLRRGRVTHDGAAPGSADGLRALAADSGVSLVGSAA